MVKWVHVFFIKGHDFWALERPKSASVAIKAIFDARQQFQKLFVVLKVEQLVKFPMKEAYLNVVENQDSVPWRKLVWGPRHVPKAFWLCASNALQTSMRIMQW